MENKLRLDSFKVTAYDVEDKKAVMIFETTGIAGRYIMEDTYRGRIIHTSFKQRSKHRKHRFGRTLCYRRANAEQEQLLGDAHLVILDERYNIPPACNVEGGFNSTRGMLYKHCVTNQQELGRMNLKK